MTAQDVIFYTGNIFSKMITCFFAQWFPTQFYMPNNEMPLAQTHLYEESEDDVEISAFSESYGLVGSDGYRAWHILNIGDDGDDDVVGDHHGLYHY